MKLKLFFISLISISPTLILFPLASCSKNKTNPYANLEGGDHWTITSKSDAEYLIDCATSKCEFIGPTGNDIFSSTSTAVQQEKSTVLYWEYANCVATNILNNAISTPFTFDINVATGTDWYNTFGTDDPSSTGYNGNTSSHNAILSFINENSTFNIQWDSQTSFSSASIYYK